MIQWITMEMWAGGNHPGHPRTGNLIAEMDRRREEYWKRWESFKHQLPPALVEADSRLHDAELIEAHSDNARAELRLLVRPWGQPAERWAFLNVQRHQWINHQLSLAGPPGFGHLGYSEIQPHKDGFSMSILFSTGLELVVRAKGFKIELPSLPHDTSEL